jgi:hypothetical protein
VNPQFQNALRFSEGLAPVCLGGKWGYISAEGNLAINPQYEEAGLFAGGLAHVRAIGKYGLIDKEGKYVWSQETPVPKEDE